MDGINQIHVNPQIGLTFASGLRHIVRQDPDVIMVGEIRDRETADVAIRAALTGHLVFSTLHTNDAPSAITRLTDMGVENYLITSSLVAVLAQRLVRVICPHCKQPNGTGALSRRRKRARPGAAPAAPNATARGYTSRMGIFEMMDVNDEVRKLIMNNADASVLTRTARKNGMRNLREDGWRKIAGRRHHGGRSHARDAGILMRTARLNAETRRRRVSAEKTDVVLCVYSASLRLCAEGTPSLLSRRC